MRIIIYTKKGESRHYKNVDRYDVHNVGPGLLTFRHDDRYIEYYRLGSIDRWTIEMEDEEGFQNGIGNTEIRYRFRKMNDVEKEYASDDEKLAYKDGCMSALSDVINSVKDSNKSEISSQELLSGLEDWYLTKLVELEA